MCDFGASTGSIHLSRHFWLTSLTVYNLSVLSNIPLSLLDSLTPASSHRLRPLFTIGVHDIPFLVKDLEDSKRRNSYDVEGDESTSGWIACTTDSILAMKDTLWDMLITMPPEHSSEAKEKAWPVVECPRGTPIKATQRDLRRFNALRAGLVKLATTESPEAEAPSAPRPDSPQSERSAVRLSSSHSARLVRAEQDEAMNTIIEPQSWASLAYNGFMWWASAGEQLHSEEQDEAVRDASLLAGLGSKNNMSMHVPSASRSDLHLTESIASLTGREESDERKAGIELAIIAYFHRLTAQILTVLTDIVDSDEAYPQIGERYRDDEDEDTDALVPETADDAQQQQEAEREAEEPVAVDSHAIETMGLDVWSANDAVFIQELCRRYFERDARTEAKGVEVCGVRVC